MSLLVLGLDGAGFDLVSRLMDAGELPNLAALARAGAFGPLRSTTPPITGPSWLGLTSGLDTDQTGIVDFLVPRRPLFEMRPISSRDFEGRTLWDLAAAVETRVAVFNFPILYPPYPVNGVMISGFGTDESTQWTFPATLKRELLDEVGPDYNLTINYHHELYEDVGRFLDDVEASLERRLRAAEFVCRRERWDLFVLVLSETDWMLHRCWADLDESHPRYDRSRSPAVADRVRRVWRRIDAAIPTLLDALGGDASVFVCSDHGFGPNTSTVRINLLLEREGLLVRRPAVRRSGGAVRRAAARAAQRAGAVTARLGGPLGRAVGRIRRRARRYLPRDESAYLASVIDFDASTVFDPGHTIPFGGLYVTPRLERGGARYLAALDRIEAALERAGRADRLSLDVRRTWCDGPEHGDTLPDLIVSGDSWGSTFLKADFEGPVVTHESYSSRHTGSHRVDGIYLASGPAFERVAERHRAAILDVAPTLLALFGVAAPADRRGRVLEEILAAPLGATRSAADRSRSTERGDTSGDDEADVRERLRGLGYLE